VPRSRLLAVAAVLIGGSIGHAVTAHAAPAARPGIATPSRLRGATVARVIAPTLVRARLAGRRNVWLAQAQTSWSAKAQSLLVLGSAWHAKRLWLHVLLPIRPDGSTGWIPRNNTQLSITHYWIAVEKTRRRVAVYAHGRLIRSFRAVVGKPATPTPDGLAAVYEVDRQPDPEGFLGTWALPLTILSNTLHDFGGGPGRIAIHGRGGASLQDPLGSARSHGCIRLDNTSVGWLAQMIRPGTPVQISG
jgi:lipoprotein-anchoring transpeptidase ErfK/SrfK